MSETLIKNTQIEHLTACAELQRLCFPNLPPEELLTEAHIVNHIRLFPEGQFVAIDKDTGRVVGMTAGFRTHFDFAHALTHDHCYTQATGGRWFSHHNPRGHYYYGADMTVHPDFRGRGIARAFYDARKALCRRLNLKGQVVCGMIPGYKDYKHAMQANAYVRLVITEAVFDGTLSTQLRNDFKVRGLIANYVQDTPTHGWAVLLEWRNPDHTENGLHLPQPYAEFFKQQQAIEHTL
ncbi:MAG: GNAT family N-acetyltransferase [Anaerolineae bacterium]|nr:GNAT family N-acetyltransferase [Anaerolineae bacterium]